MAVHCDVHCSVHCTCTVQNTMFVPPYIFISRMLQFCFWRRAGTVYISAPCKTHSSDLQFLPTCGANAAMLLLCLWVAALKMKVCLDWGFGTCKKGICSSSRLHIHKRNRKGRCAPVRFALFSLQCFAVFSSCSVFTSSKSHNEPQYAQICQNRPQRSK